MTRRIWLLVSVLLLPRPAAAQTVRLDRALAPPAITMQNAATANGNGTVLATTGYATALLNVTASVAMSGGTTINFECSVDGTTWTACYGRTIGSSTIATTTTTTGDFQIAVGAYQQARARISAYSSGTITVKGYLGVFAASPELVNANVIGTVPVSGTFWQATQPVSAASLPLPSGAATAAKQPALGTAGSASADVLSVQGIASMTALKVDGSAVTQPISAASLPLPSGASTAAKQPALGTAGSAATDVITVQGISGATAVKVDGSTVTQPVSGTVTANLGTLNGAALDASVTGLEVTQGSTTSGQKGALVQGAVTTSAPSYTTAQTSPLSLTTAGALRVDNSGVTQPVSGTVTANAGTNLNTSALALEAGGNLAIVKTNTDPLVASGAGGYVRQDSTASIAKESGGNLATIATNTTGVATAANQATANASLSSLVTNTNPLATSTGGGYVRQDNTATIARESGGNLTSIAQALAGIVAGLHGGALPMPSLNDRAGFSLRGTFNAPIGSVGDALKVTPAAPISADPCFHAKKGNVAISQTATTKLVAGLPGQVIYVCGAYVVAGAAEIASFLEGTGSACATSPIAVTGSTTAPNGESYAANGGISRGAGNGTVMVTSKPGNDLCLGQSTSNRLAGNLTFVYGAP